MTTPAAPVRILFVCTANQVRSPYAEAVARRLVSERGLPVELASAGFLDGGLPAFDEMAEIARERGLDLSTHRSRRVTARLLEPADLVVAMTGHHVLDLVALDPNAVARVLTLRELAAACEENPPRWEPGEVREWAVTPTSRYLTVLLGGDFDVDDPAGGSWRGYRRVADEIDRLVAATFGPRPDEGAGPAPGRRAGQ